MDNETLRKVQLELLGILEEVDRVCKKNNIQYFLDSGTLIGAIRHKGFIPWDDDLDIGMLRADYEKFNEVAQRDLGKDYYWQTWHTDDEFALPYGKVRKRHTVYLEQKGRELKENGFFIDVLPYDFAPDDESERDNLKKRQRNIHRALLMKAGYRPWIINGKVDMKRRIGYLPYQLKTVFSSKKSLIKKYENLTNGVLSKKMVYQQLGRKFYPIEWMSDTILVEFEGEKFPAVSHYHDWLTVAYGDYMTPPPVEERENMHQIYKIKFSK